MMTTIQRTFAKGFWPVLLLSAALSLPATSTASPSPKDKAHTADKAQKNHDKGERKQAKQASREARKFEQRLQKRQEKAQRQQARDLRAERRLQAQQRLEGRRQAGLNRRAEIRRQAALQQQARVERQLRLDRQAALNRRAELQRQASVERQLRLRREAELQRRAERDRLAYRAPVVRGSVPYAVRNRPWYGWQNRRGYSRFGSGSFQLDGTFIGQQYGCALVQDHNGQVIPLLGNPGDLRRGEHLLLSGRIQSSSVCGTAFRVFSVDRVWTDASHRRLVFDRRYDDDRYDDRYEDRYDDRYDDDYDDRYDSDNRRLISVEGEIDRNLVCTSLRADDGERYGLSGDLQDFRDGDYVRVIGFLEGRSFCGGRTIEVQEIHG